MCGGLAKSGQFVFVALQDLGWDVVESSGGGVVDCDLARLTARCSRGISRARRFVEPLPHFDVTLLAAAFAALNLLLCPTSETESPKACKTISWHAENSD